MPSIQRTDTREEVASEPDSTVSAPAPSPVNLDGGRETVGSSSGEGSVNLPRRTLVAAVEAFPGSTSGSTPGFNPGSTSSSTPRSNPGSTSRSTSAQTRKLKGCGVRSRKRFGKWCAKSSNEEHEMVRREVQEALQEAKLVHNPIVNGVRALNSFLHESDQLFADRPYAKYKWIFGSAIGGGASAVGLAWSAIGTHGKRMAGWNIGLTIAFATATLSAAALFTQLFVGRPRYFKSDRFFWGLLIVSTLMTVTTALACYADFVK